MRLTQRAVAGAVVAAFVMVATVVAAQNPFPNTRSRGRSTVEFYDKQVRIVASYDYSQRDHDQQWLLIQLAMSSKPRMTIEPTAIGLRAPDGTEIPLATQERVGEDIVEVQRMLQNALTRRHNTASYFNQRDRVEDIRLFRLPFGNVVHRNFLVDNDRVAAGDLLFESSTGTWAAGLYTLVIRHELGQAQLPITLK